MLRTLFKSDITQLMLIEESVHIAPWNREAFLVCFQSGYKGWAVVNEDKILGFIIISLQSVEECHILNIAVSRENQHQGYGLQLLEHAIRYAKENGAGIAYLEVRKSNTRALGLYRKTNFHLVGERKNYYPTVNGHEDALIFAKNLTDSFEL